MKRERVFAFDFIRFAAMFLIIVFHYNMVSSLYSVKARPILFFEYANGVIGHIGVSLFFVLSGASLMYSYRGGLRLNDYLKKRFFSIYPLYWITFIAFFVHFYIFHHIPMVHPKSTLILSFLGMDGYLLYKIPNYYLVGEWFVGCILLFYLLFPLLRRLVLTHPFLTAAVTVILYIPYEAMYPFQMEKEWFLLSVLFLPMPLPQLYLIMWAGMSSFGALGWLSQFLEVFWLRKILEAASACSFAIFLVHHVLLLKFIDPVKGLSLDFWQNHLLFLRYFLYITAVGVIFYFLSKLCVNLGGLLWRTGAARLRLLQQRG